MVKYDLYENPPRKGWHGKARLHARVVTVSTVNFDSLARMIQDCTSLSVSDAKAALTAFTEMIAWQLKEGKRVHLEGLGAFQLTLNCPVIYDPKEIRAESIKVKSVVFQPDNSFKRRFINVPLQRATEKRHSNRYSESEVDGLLMRYFMNHPYISGGDFRRLCGFTKSTGTRWLRRLQEQEKLRRLRLSGSYLYEPIPGWYGR